MLASLVRSDANSKVALRTYVQLTNVKGLYKNVESYQLIPGHSQQAACPRRLPALCCE